MLLVSPVAHWVRAPNLDCQIIISPKRWNFYHENITLVLCPLSLGVALYHSEDIIKPHRHYGMVMIRCSDQDSIFYKKILITIYSFVIYMFRFYWKAFLWYFLQLISECFLITISYLEIFLAPESILLYIRLSWSQIVLHLFSLSFNLISFWFSRLELPVTIPEHVFEPDTKWCLRSKTWTI